MQDWWRRRKKEEEEGNKKKRKRKKKPVDPSAQNYTWRHFRYNPLQQCLLARVHVAHWVNNTALPHRSWLSYFSGEKCYNQANTTLIDKSHTSLQAYYQQQLRSLSAGVVYSAIDLGHRGTRHSCLFKFLCCPFFGDRICWYELWHSISPYPNIFPSVVYSTS